MDTKNKRIFVTGATGQQGGAVANHLLDRGFQVLALVRDPAKAVAQELRQRGAELLRGDLNDPDSYRLFLKDCYGVYSVQNPMDSGGVEAEIRQGTSLADAAKDAGVEHFIYSSIAGANLDTGIPFYDSKWEIEQYIRASGLPYTIVRPVAFMENWHNYQFDQIMEGVIRLPLDPDKPIQMIAVDDIGGFVALCFEHPEEWIGQEVELAGDTRTVPQVAEILVQLAGRPVLYEQISWDQCSQQTGEAMTKMYRWLNDVGYTVDIQGLRRVYPRLATLDQVLSRESWQMRMTA